MGNRHKIIILFLAVTVMLWLASSARRWIARRPDTAKNNVIFADQYDLSGVYHDSLAVVAEQATLVDGSRVTGDAALVGNENVLADGLVDGDLTMAGEALVLGENGRVAGDLSAMGTTVTIGGAVEGRLTVIGDELLIRPRAQVAGDIVACVNSITDQREDVPPLQPCRDVAALLKIFSPLQALSEGDDLSAWAASGAMTAGGLLFSLATSLLLTGLSALAVMIFPHQFSLMQEAVTSTPRRLAALGCMALLLAVGLSTGVVAVLTIVPRFGLILVPIGLLLGLALAVMLVAGWITLALLLGDFALRHLTRSIQPPVIDTAFGSLLLFALWHVLAILPFGSVIGVLLMVALGSAGLGGALATRMGTRPLRRQYFVQG